MTGKHRLSRTFGHQQVDPQQREALIRSVFNRVAPRYDLMNDLMSMGVHRWWKWRFCRAARPHAGTLTVDLAAGSGDIAARLLAPGRELFLVDPSEAMLAVAQQRLAERVQYLPGYAEDIPCADSSADLITMSFGLRNTTDVLAALADIHRVLKPGGWFFCLEFSEPAGWLTPFYARWNRWVIPRLGQLIAGHPDAYLYLIESIREFPPQAELAGLMQQAGFREVRWTNLSFGICAIHCGRKPA